MPLQLHMTITGNTQGEIKGFSKIKDREGTHEVLALNHAVTVPYEQRTGDISNRREHHPLTVLRMVDEATPMLYKALTSSEHLTVEIKWYRPHPDGGAREQHYFTTKMETAKLTSVEAKMPDMTEGRSAGVGHLEYLSFIYKKITWTDEVNGAQHISDWIDTGA